MTLKCSGCEKQGQFRLSCPTCIKLGVSTSIFCSQDCFKGNWDSHKSLHKAVKQLTGLLDVVPTQGHESLQAGVKFDDRLTWRKDKDLRRFDGFTFTGPLRPWPQTPMVSVPQTILTPDYYKTGFSASELRARDSHKIVVRTPEEIELLRVVCRLGRETLDLAHSMVKPGVTPDAIDRAVHEFVLDNDAYPSPLNYSGFPKSCCISVNEVVCHGIPDLRPLEDGDIVNVDISVYRDGFHSDLNETFLCGTVDEASKHLVKGAYECMMEAIAECRPGMMYREIGNIISKVAESRNLSVVRTYCGHGIGTLFHTTPSIPHYKKNKAIGVMKAGHVFTIEPMINAGVWQDVTWPDEWTSVTVDGKRSAQFEHTVVVTETGVELLTGRLPTSPPLGIDVQPEEYYLKKSKSQS